MLEKYPFGIVFKEYNRLFGNPQALNFSIHEISIVIQFFLIPIHHSLRKREEWFFMYCEIHTYRVWSIVSIQNSDVWVCDSTKEKMFFVMFSKLMTCHRMSNSVLELSREVLKEHPHLYDATFKFLPLVRTSIDFPRFNFFVIDPFLSFHHFSSVLFWFNCGKIDFSEIFSSVLNLLSSW